MAQVPSAATQFGLDIWSQITKHCDRDTLRLLSTHQVHSVVRESALPYLFKDLHFKASNLLRPDDRSLTLIPQEYENLLDARADQCCQRFTQLPLSRLAPYVRVWFYDAHFDDDGEPEAAVKSKIDKYNRDMWRFFAANLARYTELTSLSLTKVVVDETAVRSLNTLANLKSLMLFYADITSTINLGSPYIRLIVLEHCLDNFHSGFIIGACATLASLRIQVGKKDYRTLYDVLEHCPVLEELLLTLRDVIERVFEAPAEALSITACPNLTTYLGPAYYAGVIQGRPVRDIDISRCPEDGEMHVEWLKICGSGTVPVEEFSIYGWPTYAIPGLFPVIIENFPHLMALRIVFSPYVLEVYDMEDRENYKKLHYLSVIQDVSTGKYEVPRTLRSLGIFQNRKYKKHRTITIAQVVDRIQSSERFADLDRIMFGYDAENFHVWCIDETDEWSITQYGEENIDGEDGDDSSDEYTDDDHDE